VIGGLVALALAGCFGRQPVTVAIADYGTYDAVVETSGDWSRGVPVDITAIHNLVHDQTAYKIPARGDVNWGYCADITNNGDRPVKVLTIFSHPPITTPDGKTTTEDKGARATVNPGQTIKESSIWYFLDGCSFEFVPGDWTIEISVDGKIQASKTFQVYAP
jgi:hypothetical protein